MNVHGENNPNYKEGRKVTMSFRTTEERRATVKVLAEAKGCNTSDMINSLIDDAYDKHGIDTGEFLPSIPPHKKHPPTPTMPPANDKQSICLSDLEAILQGIQGEFEADDEGAKWAAAVAGAIWSKAMVATNGAALSMPSPSLVTLSPTPPHPITPIPMTASRAIVLLKHNGHKVRKVAQNHKQYHPDSRWVDGELLTEYFVIDKAKRLGLK